jgi:hypothetical protein
VYRARHFPTNNPPPKQAQSQWWCPQSRSTGSLNKHQGFHVVLND